MGSGQGREETRALSRSTAARPEKQEGPATADKETECLGQVLLDFLMYFHTLQPSCAAGGAVQWVQAAAGHYGTTSAAPLRGLDCSGGSLPHQELCIPGEHGPGKHFPILATTLDLIPLRLQWVLLPPGTHPSLSFLSQGCRFKPVIKSQAEKLRKKKSQKKALMNVHISPPSHGLS